MDLETIRVVISVVALVMLALIWRILRRIYVRLGRITSRQDAEAHALHILAQAPGSERHMRSLPPRS